MSSICYILFLTAVTFVMNAHADDHILADIKDIRPHQVKVEGFRLNSEQTVDIEAVGFRRSRRMKTMFTRAWILDAHSREVVWQLRDAEVLRKSRYFVEFEDRVTLPAGEYEVYYSSYPVFYGEDWKGLIDKIFEGIFDANSGGELHHAYKREWDRFKIVIKGKGRRFEVEQMSELRRVFTQDAFVNLTGLGDDANERRSFELKKDLDVFVYALGESRDDGTFDYGWIINLESRKKVWKFNLQDSEHAGGAKKNREIRQTLFLPKGKYLASVVTDDSHSAGDWNEAPPNDPFFWGLTIKPAEPSQRRFVVERDNAEVQQKKALLQFTRLGNDEYRSKYFVCKKDVDVHIYAIGEGEHREMFDYAWILDSKTHERVWAMNYRNTEHAGGGEKNRLFDGIVHLQRGDYVLCFVTDDSHSYWEWNTAPPYDRENWGVTVYAVGDQDKASEVFDFQAVEKRAVVAQIIDVHDDDRERESFVINHDREVDVYAIGEGSGGRMHDYGWIEDAETRDVVWEMTFRKTQHAGGSKKNRMVNDRIFLSKGRYILFYETDDSHSCEEWNADPPYDQKGWGITLYQVEN